GGHHLAREDLARLDQQQTPHVLLGDYQVTGQLHVVDGIQLALVDVDGDVDVFLVRGNGYLGGGDIHVDVAAVQVPGTQTLQVAGEFFAGILVVVANEGQPAGGLELEQRLQFLIGEYRVADHVDVLDGRHRAFVHDDLQGNAVARLGNPLGIDGRRITALGNILTQQQIGRA